MTPREMCPVDVLPYKGAEMQLPLETASLHSRKSVMRKLVWLSITQCWVTFLDPGTLLCTFPIDSFQNTLWETQIQKNGIWWGSQVHFGGSFLAHTALGLRPRALFFILTSIFKDVSVCMFLCVYTHMCRVPIKTENSMGLPWS